VKKKRPGYVEVKQDDLDAADLKVLQKRTIIDVPGTNQSNIDKI